MAFSDLATLDFAKDQKEELEKELGWLAAKDDRVPLLVQLPGVGLLIAMTILATIGDITRFPTAKHLVGYAGLHGRVHQSGETQTTGKLVSLLSRNAS